MTRRLLAPALLGALLALVALPLLAAAPASAGRTVTVSITANGTKPASATAAVGDTVTFVNDDPTFVHQVANKSPNWRFNSQPLTPGQHYTTPALTTPGTYDYQGVNLDSFVGRVVVPASTAPAAAPAPTKSSAAAPSGQPRSPVPSPSASAAGSPSPPGGTAVVAPPPLAGGFGALTVSPAPGAGALPPALAPNVAPTPVGQDVGSPAPSGSAIAIGTGRLPEPPTGRRYGLPAAVAAVAAVGVASLLIRLLLAHPNARRSREVTATID
ncbi:MAG: hypothetical protein NVSMB55_10600 [Mycobacteriales bacterium]